MSTSAYETTNASHEDDWETKVVSLSRNAKTVKSLTLTDRFDIANELLGNIKSFGDDKLYQHDMAVFKLGPHPEGSEAIKYPSNVKNLIGFNKFGTIALLVPALKSIKKNLEYQIAIENGLGDKAKKTSIWSKVKEEEIGGRKMNIHGPVEIFPLFHKLELWADATAVPELPKSSDIESQVDNEHGISVVLGAGNQSAITIFDALYCFFNHPGKPILIKHHPLRPHLHSFCSEFFAPLIKRGFLDQLLDKGVERTQAILTREEVKHVHMTGSLGTAQAIEATLAETRPHMSKGEIENMLTTELGCVTPWIIAPGKYSKRELNMAAKHIVTGKKLNAGCNCVCSQAVIIPEAWAQKEEFKRILMKSFANIPTDPLYYPGSCEKVKDIASHYDPVKVTQVPARAVVRNIVGDESDFMDPYIVDCGTYGNDNFNGHALRNEAFGPLLVIMELPGTPDDNYLLDKAVPFVNNKDNIYGSLSCCLVFPKKYDAKIVREAAGALNYGCVALNTWSFYGYLGLGHGGTWGGSKFDTTGQSGRGMIGNLHMIPNVEKTVVSSRALTFPLIIDKNLVPPKMLCDAASGVLLAKNAGQSIRAVASTLLKPITSCFK